MVNPIVVISDESVAETIRETEPSVVHFDTSDVHVEMIEMYEPSAVILTDDSEGAERIADRFAGYRTVVGIGDGKNAVQSDTNATTYEVESVEEAIAIADGVSP